MKYYLTRLLNDRAKTIVILAFISIPCLELVIYIREAVVGQSLMDPQYATFLAAGTVGHGHMTQGIILWFLPLYLTILVCEDVMQDYKTGNKAIMISKLGNVKYIRTNYIKGFVVSFFLMFITLIINYVLVTTTLSGGTYSPHGKIDASDLLLISINHPEIANMCFIVLTSFLCGVVGVTAVSIALAFPNRQIAYPASFLLWFLPATLSKSTLILTQPFTEYNLDDIAYALTIFAAVNAVTIVLMYCKERKKCKTLNL